MIKQGAVGEGPPSRRLALYLHRTLTGVPLLILKLFCSHCQGVEWTALCRRLPPWGTLQRGTIGLLNLTVQPPAISQTQPRNKLAICYFISLGFAFCRSTYTMAAMYICSLLLTFLFLSRCHLSPRLLTCYNPTYILCLAVRVSLRLIHTVQSYLCTVSLCPRVFLFVLLTYCSPTHAPARSLTRPSPLRLTVPSSSPRRVSR